MILADAQSKFESKFEEVTADDKQQGDKDLPVFWSGGKRGWEEPSAALYATKEMAVINWLDTVMSYAEGGNLKWILKPELIEYQITIADKLGRHRSVNNRFAVKSQFKMGAKDA